MKKNIIIGLLLILIVGLTGCTNSLSGPLTQTNTNQTSFQTELSSSQKLKEFNNINDLKEFLSQQSTTNEYYSYNGAIKSLARSDSIAVTSATPEASGAGKASSDYSQTNIQIKGVDEADFIKNDANYIYMIKNNELVIIEANAKDSKIISQTTVNTQKEYYSYVQELFLNKDKVIIFVNTYESSFYLEKYNIEPIETQKPLTTAKIYDVSNREKPKLLEEITITGSYYNSRMINDVVYIISQEGLYDWIHYTGPMIKSSTQTIVPKMYYFDNQEQNYQMNTITSINLESNKIIDSKSVMLGYSNTLMISENNIYVAYEKQNYWCFGWRCNLRADTDNRERFVTVVAPLLPQEIKNKVDNILSQKLDEETEWNKISIEFNKFYTQLMNDKEMQEEYEDTFIAIEDALNEYDTKKALENSKTTIHKFSINNGQIEYKSKGEIEGKLLNQFSLDEYKDNLRVATTTSMWLSKGGRVQYNNVFVLDQELNLIGSLKNLAQNESIYSSRFMGDKLYLVTFRQIDPFFVIDLSNTNNPKVLGYLKIPGYSSYLHPIDNNLIIGVGKETTTNEYGGTITKGVKISLFDVTDFSNPKEVSKYEIGIEGTDSPILYDHKAFLYSATKNILVIPVSEVVEKVKSGQYNYRSKIMNGAYVFEIKDNKFSLIKKIKHSSVETDYYYWIESASVTRSLYIDDTLYTISDKYIKVNDIANDLDDLTSIDLPIIKYTEPEPTTYYGEDVQTASVVE
jgi:uncharacterized secreted protein with C-terminal beta-propeller domain